MLKIQQSILHSISGEGFGTNYKVFLVIYKERLKYADLLKKIDKKYDKVGTNIDNLKVSEINLNILSLLINGK